MEERSRRPAPRLVGLLACAVVTLPVLLVAGCSSHSGSGSGSHANSGSNPGSPSSKAPSGAGAVPTSTTPPPTPARFAAIPPACKAATTATLATLVPKAKSPAGTATRTTDVQSRSGCSWTGNGPDGYQYRWLSVTLQRFGNDPQLGPAEDQAKKRYAEQLQEVGKAAYGAPTTPLTGLGDEAAQVSGRTTVAKVTSQNDTVVAREGNVVVIVEYEGAGLAGKKNPDAKTVTSGAQRVARDALTAVAAANA